MCRSVAILFVAVNTLAIFALFCRVDNLESQVVTIKKELNSTNLSLDDQARQITQLITKFSTMNDTTISMLLELDKRLAPLVAAIVTDDDNVGLRALNGDKLMFSISTPSSPERSLVWFDHLGRKELYLVGSSASHSFGVILGTGTESVRCWHAVDRGSGRLWACT